MTTTSPNPVSSRLPATTSIGSVHLIVSDLERSVAFYTQAIGLELRDQVLREAALGVGETNLVVLHEERGARPSIATAGLFHLALRVPTRPALASWLASAANVGVPLTGLSDHFVSEAIYLNDPDVHGIEIYWDRPRELWEGQVARRLTTAPLDTADLLRELERDDAHSARLPVGTDVGHIHLRVGSLPEAVAFYDGVLGFDTMASVPGAAFLSAGGYHHHVGINTWQSSGASAAPTGYARLDHATILVPDDAALSAAAARVEAAGYDSESLDEGIRVRDPFGTALVLSVDATLR